MIEPYRFLLERGTKPSLPIHPLVSTGGSVGLEGSIIQPTPPQRWDEAEATQNGSRVPSGLKRPSGKGAEDGD